MRGTQEKKRNLIKGFLHGIISGKTQEKIHSYKKSRWLLNYKTNNEIKPTNKYKGSVLIFDNMLASQKSDFSEKQKDIHFEFY